MDIAITDVIHEIDEFQKLIKGNTTSKFFFIKRRQHKATMQKYGAIISHLDEITLFFKLQQAQLLKEVKLIEELNSIIQNSIIELVGTIQRGN